MRQPRFITALVLAAMVATAACASRRAGTAAGDAATADSASVIVVDNRGFDNMTIYLLESGTVRRRLGSANGLSKVRLPIPRSVVGNGRELQFIADPIGSSRASVSQRIFVRPGDEVVMTIMP